MEYVSTAMNQNQTRPGEIPPFSWSQVAPDPFTVRNWCFYSLSGSSWSAGSLYEGWDWTESARLQSPQMHCSSQTQKSKGLHTGSTPWWSLCRWMQSGPKSRKKIGNTHICVYLVHICGHMCLPRLNKTQPHHHTQPQSSSGDRSITVRNMTWFDSSVRTGMGPEWKDHILPGNN